jgi:hypothetical protein
MNACKSPFANGRITPAQPCFAFGQGSVVLDSSASLGLEDSAGCGGLKRARG